MWENSRQLTEPKLISGVFRTFENSPNPFFLKFSGHRGQYPREVSKFDFNFLVNTSFYKVFMQSQPRVNPFAPGDFAEKRVLKLVKWFSGHCRAIKS